ncbi:MAG TPA: hypothetical protein VM576_02365 [Xanthomonadaceae bacterium]|nr:hypothetical protein [Xanthomonadaceae bacterium]
MRKLVPALLLATAWSAGAQTQVAPATPPAPGFVVEHVPERLSAREQEVEDRCVRATGSHAVRRREERQTKGTTGTHGECAGQGFSGSNNDLESGLQSPAIQ